MRIEVIQHTDLWPEIKRAALNTVGKDSDKYPTSDWKRKLIMSEHSPIRIGKIIVKLHDIPTFVSTHLVRHKHGVEHFVTSRRDDRATYEEIPNRNTPVTHVMELNFQAILNISRKRLCCKSHITTQKVWTQVLDAIREYEPELVACCVPDCGYRGHCPEFKSCGFVNTHTFGEMVNQYRKQE